MLRFWLKILKMEPDRTPHQLFLQLKKKAGSIPLEMNWALQIKYILQQVNMESLWEETDTSIIEAQLAKNTTCPPKMGRRLELCSNFPQLVLSPLY